jgi:8-oxo-dGTP diphosphatase
MDMAVIKHPVVEVGAVVLHYGSVLLVKRDDPATAGRWAIPCSRLQWGESMPQTLAREVLVATGIVIQPGAVIHAYDLMLPEVEGREAEHRVIIEMEADYLDGELRRGDSVMDVAWVSAMAMMTMEIDAHTLGLLTELGFVGGEAD